MAQSMRPSGSMLSSLTGEFTLRRAGGGAESQPATSFGGLSLNLKLPLFAAGLVLFVGVALATAAVLEMRRSSYAVASGRLLSVTTQFDDLFRQSAAQNAAQAAAIASSPAVVEYARHPSPERRGAALAKLVAPTTQPQTIVGAELRDASGTVLLSAIPAAAGTALSRERLSSTGARDSARVGRFHAVGDTIFYPAVADVRGAPGVHVVQWRRLAAQNRSRDQLQQLIGSGATLYIANRDGSAWSNLERPVPALPVTPSRPARIQLIDAPNGPQLVTAVPVLASPWMFAIAFPEQGVLEPIKRFALRLGAITAVGMLIAIGVAWYGTRRIAIPLRQLTDAADRMAAGEPVPVTRIDRSDELGRLSDAFDTMAAARTDAERQLRRMNEELESRVRQRTQDLEAANRELETFSYSVSHDLRTPLRALDGFSQALLDDYAAALDDTGRGYLNRIRRGSQRMGDLIDAMLLLSRVSRGEVRREPVNLSGLASDAIESLRLAHPDRRVEVHVADGVEVTGDAPLLRTLLGNLIGNAWKFTSRAPEPRIEFTSSLDPQRGRVFSVRDNGVGFDMNYAAKLFGAFQRLHSNAEFDGTGIGLATAQRIVHRHGGEIWAESQPDRGAAFSFTLR